jgi:hypothetical protein
MCGREPSAALAKRNYGPVNTLYTHRCLLNPHKLFDLLYVIPVSGERRLEFLSSSRHMFRLSEPFTILPVNLDMVAT